MSADELAKIIVEELERQIDKPFKTQTAREVALSVIAFWIAQYAGALKRTDEE